MKYSLIAIFILISLKSFAKDNAVSRTIISETEDDVNTPTPKDLEGAVIIVKTKDGKIHKMNTKNFKIVKRKQQFKNKKTVILEHAECPEEVVKTQFLIRTIIRKAHENRNLVTVGARYDYVGLKSGISADRSSAYIEARRATVFDLSYMRRRVFDSRLGAGIGIDTNGTPRVFGGIEF